MSLMAFDGFFFQEFTGLSFFFFPELSKKLTDNTDKPTTSSISVFYYFELSDTLDILFKTLLQGICSLLVLLSAMLSFEQGLLEASVHPVDPD